MGIRGLKSFIENNSDLKRCHQLHDTGLVIDGNNLIYSLYWKSSNAANDHLYAGDYNRYAESVRQFFRALQKCRIEALVVMDGGIDPSEQKVSKIIERFHKNLSNAKQISRGNVSNDKIIASLCKPVFLEVLSDLSVPHIQASFEADSLVARIANQLQCPVLSNDSDFFVYDLRFGVISIDNIVSSLTVHTYTDPNDPSLTYKYLDCNLYLIDTLIEYFPGLKREILPLFSTLMGNDYVEASVFDNIFNAIPEVKAFSRKKSKSLHVGKRHLRMIRLLDWLRGRSLDESVDFLINFLGKNSRNNALNLLRISLENYCDDVSAKEDTQLLDLSNLTALLPNRDPSLPQWFVDEFRQSLLSTSLMNVIKMKKEFLGPRVEDFALASTYTAGLQLRQYLFALLRSNDKDLDSILMFDRVGTQLSTYSLEPQLATPNSLHILPHLHQIRSLTITERRVMVADILSIDDTLLETIESVFGDHSTKDSLGAIFLIVCLRYWLRKCPHQIWLEFIYALLACIICSGYVGTYILVKFVRLTDAEAKQLSNSLKPYNTRPQHNSSKLYQPRIAHFFNEFQDCLKLIRCLNILFECPFEMGRPFFCLNGVLIYNLTVELSSRKDPTLFLSILFGRQSTTSKIFDKLLNVVIDEFVGNNDKLVRCLTVANRRTHLKSQKMRSNNRGVRVKKSSVNGLDNRFSALQI